MKSSFLNFFSFLLLALSLTAGTVFAAPISSSYNTVSFRDTDLNGDAVMDKINWKPSNGTPVNVTDTAVTGTIWGETVGWINLNPANGGITNTCSGVLSGYAWGQNTGWINFKPTNGGVVIDVPTGNFSGYAWSENYGWIHFDPSVSAKHVQTDWHGCPVSNPSGYLPVDPTNPDMCPNINGIQTTIPSGYEKLFGICSPISITACNDGIDNDSDGLIDTSDPGCTSLTDNSELNIKSIFACNDGIDNDNDGFIDLSDPGCTKPYDISEYNNINQIKDPVKPVESVPSFAGSNIIDKCPQIDGIQNDESLCGSEKKIVSETVRPKPKLKLKQSNAIDIASVREVLKPAAVLMTAVAIAGVVSTVPGFVARIGHFLLTFLLYRRRNPWGIVYDSRTKQPLDPAMVIVTDVNSGKDIEQKTTDIEGRYGFYLQPGTYRISAGKTHYEFPSKILMNKNSDGTYDDLYFGQEFTVPPGRNRDRVVTMNIPMDSVGEDWNQLEKKRMGLMGYLTKQSPIWNIIAKVLFVAGFAFSAIVTYLYPSNTNYIVLGLYVLVLILSVIGFGSITAGTITQAGKPLANVLVRLYNANLRTETGHRTTDSEGHYYILVPNGKYYATVEEHLPDGTSQVIYTSEVFEISQGVMNESFKI